MTAPTTPPDTGGEDPWAAEDRSQAYRAVRSAIERGTLVRPAQCSRCDAPDTKAKSGRHTIQAHHHKGYDAPLDVEWLCAACHRKETPLPAVMGGPALGSSNGAARLTEYDVAMIRRSPLGSTTLGRHYGVDKKTIQRARNGETWIAAAPPAVGEGS